MQSPLPFMFLALSSAAQGNYSPRTDLEEGRYLKALAEAETQIKLSPTNALAWAAKAHSLSALLRFGEALEAANRSLSLNPNLADGYLARGLARGGAAVQQRSFGSLRQLGAAMDDLRTATTLDPTLAQAWTSLALAYQALPGIFGGSTRKALNCAEKFRGMQPSRGEALKGLIFSMDKRWREAEPAFGLALAQGASDWQVVGTYLDALGSRETRETLGETAQKNKLLQEGRRLLSGVQTKAKGVEAVSEAFLNAGQPEEGWKVAEVGLEQVEAPSLLRLQLGKIAARAGIHREQGLAYLRKVIGEPLEGGSGGYPAAYWRQGQILLAIGRKNDARSSALESLRLDPQHRGATRLLEEVR